MTDSQILLASLSGSVRDKECDHIWVLRHYSRSNQYRYNCSNCGRSSKSLKHDSLTDEEKRLAPPPDHGVASRWYDARCRKFATEKTNARTNAKDDWFSKHNDYLKSPQWHQRRDMVLARDKNICQACLTDRATQVHHLTYKHWRHEPLFELVSVCQSCHYKITQMDRK